MIFVAAEDGMIGSGHHATSVPVEFVYAQDFAGAQFVGVFVEVHEVSNDGWMRQVPGVMALEFFRFVLPQFLAVFGVEGVSVEDVLFVGSGNEEGPVTVCHIGY